MRDGKCVERRMCQCAIRIYIYIYIYDSGADIGEDELKEAKRRTYGKEKGKKLRSASIPAFIPFLQLVSTCVA